MIPVSIIVLAEASIMTTVGTLLGGEGNLLITELKPKVYFLLAGPPAVLPLTTSPHLLNRFKHVIPIKIGGYVLCIVLASGAKLIMRYLRTAPRTGEKARWVVASDILEVARLFYGD